MRATGLRRATRATALLLLAGALASAVGPLAVRRRAAPAAAEPLVTFHVVANSDRPEDQALKLRVRDAVAPVLLPLVASAAGPREAGRLVWRHREDLVAAAAAAVRRSGRRDPVRLEVRSAAGRERLRLVIGAGAGHNWFCVLYPPLCLAARAGQSPEEVVAAFRLDRAGDQDAWPIEVRSAVADWLRSLRGRLVLVLAHP